MYIDAPSCMKCGKPLFDSNEELCHDCRKQHFHYERGYAIWLYEGKIKETLYQYKYQGKREYVYFYVEELLARLSKQIIRIQPDALVPIPIHKSKKHMRGYNQAELLAIEAGKALGIPVLRDLLYRDKRTLPQKNLNNKERIRNLREAFSINKTLIESYTKKLNVILLVDDIYTTGSTIEACTRILLANGVNKVYFVTLCIGKGLY